MNFRTSYEGTTCAQCDHLIVAGSLCISLVPIAGESAARDEADEFAVLHLECEQCDFNDSCFVRYASRRTPIEAVEDGVCAYCQHEFEAGQPILTETIVLSEEVEQELDETQEPDTQAETEGAGERAASSRWKKRGLGVFRRAGGAVAAPAKMLSQHVPERFRDLSPGFQSKVSRAGLRSWLKPRTMAESESLWENSVPKWVRHLGGTEKFVDGKHASHIESVLRAPDKARLDSNTIWERAASNIKRGSDNIRPLELGWIKTRNFVDASGIVARRMAGGAARGAIWSAVLEAPVSVAENLVHVRKGRESGTEAAKRVLADTTKAGATGAAVGGGMVIVVATGGGAILAPIALPMAVVGGSIFAFSSVRRIWQAIHAEPETDPVVEATWITLQFHAECSECDSGELCHAAFLNGVLPPES